MTRSQIGLRGWILRAAEVVIVAVAIALSIVEQSALALSFVVIVALRHIFAVLMLRHERNNHTFEALVRNSTDVIAILDDEGNFIYVSPSVDVLLGRDHNTLIGTSLLNLVTGNDRARASALLAMSARRPDAVMPAEWRFIDSQGHNCQAEVLVRNLRDEPAVRGIVLNLRDASDRKQLEDKLQHHQNHDQLTGLANRSLLRVRIEQALTRWLFQNEPFSLLVIDIDGFKAINDSLGHAAGDAVLTSLAERIGACTRGDDTVVRLNADEFAVLLNGVHADDSQAHLIAERIIAAIREPMSIHGHELSLRASIGLACVTDQVSQADDILRNADIAMHAVKSVAPGEYLQFETVMHDSALKRVQLEADLRRAMENDELQLYYQPTVDMATGQMEGVEALLRWPHPEKGFISPVDFIPVAEDSGLIVELGTWVLRQACNELRKWQGRYPSDPQLKMNVNLSARQLQQPDIVDTVRHAIEESGIAPGTLILEITESVLTDDKPTTLDKMHELVELGCMLAIDDFGTGYSALSYLREFPLAILKIDRSFVAGVGDGSDEEQTSLVQAIIDVAKALRLRTVAEGIETPEQMAALREMGCDTAQGFLLAMPSPAEDVRRLIEATYAAGLPVPAAVS